MNHSDWLKGVTSKKNAFILVLHINGGLKFVHDTGSCSISLFAQNVKMCHFEMNTKVFEMGLTRPLFVYFRSFHTTNIEQIL